MTETTEKLRTFYLLSASIVIIHDEPIDGFDIVATVEARDWIGARLALSARAHAEELRLKAAMKASREEMRAIETSESEPRHEGIFKSAHEALSFAFNFAQQQHPRTPMTQLIARGIPSGRGLTGMDGAAQAGMVLREVLAMQGAKTAVIIGRFSKPVECPCCHADAPSPDFSDAVETLSHEIAKPLLAGTECNSLVRRTLVRRYLRGTTSMTLLASQAGVSRRAITDYYAKIAKPLAQIEKAARAELDVALAPMVIS